MNHRLSTCSVLIAALALAGCETSKSANPTSPSVAGPIAGVTITAPKPLEPGANWTISNGDQPITLLIENSSTNGQRSLSYLFEVATDAEFATRVFSRDGVQPGSAGRTSLRLPDALGADRTYYWRAKASDGANSSSYSAAIPFTVYTPASLGAPQPISPVGAVRIESRRPEFVVRNAPRSGPVGAVSYVFEIATTESFATALAVVTVPETPNETRVTPALELPYNAQIFWRVRAFDDGSASGPWSAVQNFVSPIEATLAQPQAVSPIGGTRVSSRSPEFVVRNVARTGSLGNVSYVFEISRNDAFTALMAVVTVGEGSGETRVTPALELPTDIQVFWRVRAVSGAVVSPYSATQMFLSPVVSSTPTPAPPASGWPKTGPEVVAWAERNYPDRLVAGVSLAQRQANMAFLRDRMIEAGICGGMDLAWNLKRGGPEISIDFLVHRVNGQDIGVDIGMDYDNTSIPLQLYWGAGAPFPVYGGYSPRPSCK